MNIGFKVCITAIIALFFFVGISEPEKTTAGQKVIAVGGVTSFVFIFLGFLVGVWLS